MIEKMKFLTITGPKDDIDRVMKQYVSKYEFHLENALTELCSVKDLKPFVEINPYKNSLTLAESLVKQLDPEAPISQQNMTIQESDTIISQASNSIQKLLFEKKELSEKKETIEKKLASIEPFRMLNYNQKTIFKFKFIKVRFGKISHEYYKKFLDYIYDELSTVFIECDRDNDYVWGVYFTPASSKEKIDAVFSSLHFNRLFIPDDYDGTPDEIYHKYQEEIKKIRVQRKNITMQIQQKLDSNACKIKKAKNILHDYAINFNIRKLAACTKETRHGHTFYIICGWMTDQNAINFQENVNDDPNVYCILENNHKDNMNKPPTKLKNPKIIKPFEMFVKMYGLPAYNEMDPTIFIALTYTFIFGIMFGDIGQGICLILGGLLFYHFKKSNLGAIISIAGIWSTIFGFLYGSLFGFEEILEPIWKRPADNIMSTLIISIAFGIFLILVAMIINIINGIKEKNIEKIFFDPSGFAGFICYGTAILCIMLAFTDNHLPSRPILILLMGFPLLCIFLKEPLTRIIKKEKKIIPSDNKIMFFVEGLVELFDVILSYATNTISFVRIGAFALSHAGMMGVVLTLAHAENGTPNLLVIILGNILVTGLEGLVVGIQVLRLEYYEMFSRFYSGTGKAFKPFNSKEL